MTIAGESEMYATGLDSRRLSVSGARISPARRSRGFTFIELLCAVMLLTAGSAALLTGMREAMALTDHLARMQIVMYAVQGELEELQSQPFALLADPADPTFARARAGWQCAGEDTNCNGVLDVGEDLNGNQIIDSPLCLGEDSPPTGNCNGVLDAGEDGNANGLLDPAPVLPALVMFHIAPADLRNPASPALVDITVSACWGQRGRRFSEDVNCNGQLDVDPATGISEDLNADGIINSPAMVSTRIAKRE